jgi:branched-chain amino acid aminotransferase
MPIPVKMLLPNGKLEPAPISAGSINDAGIMEPEGIYTVARTFQQTKTVLFDAHLDRLEQSARLEGIALDLNRSWLRQGLAHFLDESGFQESRFRITIPKDNPGTIWLAAEPLKPVPPELRQKGVMVATCAVTRPNPGAKSNTWVGLRNQAIKRISDQAYEGIILSQEGWLMEGFGSNFYAILEGKLFTADQNILHGIARRIVMEIAPGFIEIQLSPIHQDQLPLLAEAFLTSSSRGIVPITQVDQTIIADGFPGDLTRTLSAAYDQWVDENMQPIA